MKENAEKDTEFQGGLFYKTEDEFIGEVKRFLSTRRKNRGATEWQIIHVARRRPFVTAFDQAQRGEGSSYFRSKQEEIRWFRSLRREAVFPIVKKLLNEDYTVAEIAAALTLPYSTVYYYAKKIRNHKRLRAERTLWHIDQATQCIAPVKLPRDEVAALARKEVMRKAKEKRERKMAKRLAHTTSASVAA